MYTDVYRSLDEYLEVKWSSLVPDANHLAVRGTSTLTGCKWQISIVLGYLFICQVIYLLDIQIEQLCTLKSVHSYKESI